MADRTLRVKIGIDTSGLKADAAEAARAFDGIGKSVTKSADEAEKSTSKVGDETAKSADKSGAAWAKVGPWMGAAIAGGAVLAGKAVLDLGMTYEQNLNQLQSVTRSTNAEMQAIGDTAMALGNDMDLPTASASDAAQAMLELAKGGLSAQEAMDSAKGTLTLAAAAQISGAEAATIQSAALNTFGLAASDAGHVADVLANVANASSGEITDFAQGMSQAGLVAKSMGVDLDSTATVLGIFANQGLSGSDAGTSFKTMLVSLQSPSEQAAGALADLGVKAYDAQGNFVGMRAVTEQLSDAQARMSTEQFNAAASTAFGTDAVRAAVAMAGQGVAGYDAMASAVSQAGGAQDVAAAQTKGVTGALNNVKNQLENTALTIYQEYSPALESMLNSAASALPGVADFFMDVLGVAGDFVGFISDLPGPVKAAAAVLGTIALVKNPVSDAFETITEKISDFKGKVDQAASASAPLVSSVAPLGAALGASGEGAQALAEGLSAAAEKAAASKSAADAVKGAADPMGESLGLAGAGADVLGDALAGAAGNSSATAAAAGEVAAATDPLAGALEGAGLSADALGEGLGAASEKAKDAKAGAEGGASGLRKLGAAGKVAGVGLMAAFGGPVGLAITAVTLAVGFLGDAFDDNQPVVSDFTGIINDQTGALNANAEAMVQKTLADSGSLTKATAAGISAETYTRFVMGQKDAVEEVNAVLATGTKHLNDQAFAGLAAGNAGVAMGQAIADDQLPAMQAVGQLARQAAADTGAYGEVLKRGFDASFPKLQEDIGTSMDGARSAAGRAGAAIDGLSRSAVNAQPPLQDIVDAWKDGSVNAGEMGTQIGIVMGKLDEMAGRNGDAEAAQRAFNQSAVDWTNLALDQTQAGNVLAEGQDKITAANMRVTEVTNKQVDATYSAEQKQLDLSAAQRDAATAVVELEQTTRNQTLAQGDLDAKTRDLQNSMLTSAQIAANTAATNTTLSESGQTVSSAYLAAKDSVQASIDKFIALQTPADIASGKARDMAIAIFGIPETRAATIIANTLTAQQQIEAFRGEMERIKTEITVNIRTNYVAMGVAESRVGKTVDDRTAMVGASGKLPGSYAGGNVGATMRGFALGGPVGDTNIRGAAAPSNPFQDNLFAFDTAGNPLTVRSDEWIINGKVSGELGPTVMGNLNDGMYPKSMFDENAKSATTIYDARGYTSAPSLVQSSSTTYTPNVQVFIGNEQLRAQIQVVVDGTPLPVAKLHAAQREAGLVY